MSDLYEHSTIKLNKHYYKWIKDASRQAFYFVTEFGLPFVQNLTQSHLALINIKL